MTALILPETLPAARRRSGGVRGTVRDYGRLFTDRAYVGLILVAGLSMAALFAYVSGSSFVLQNQFGLSEQQFAYVFAVGAVGLIGATQLNVRLLRRWTPLQILGVALIAGLAASAVLLVLAATGFGGLLGVLLPLWLVLTIVGLAMPNAPALALSRHGEAAGTAAALLGAVQFGVGALAAPLVGVLGAGAAAMAAVVLLAPWPPTWCSGWWSARAGSTVRRQSQEVVVRILVPGQLPARGGQQRPRMASSSGSSGRTVRPCRAASAARPVGWKSTSRPPGRVTRASSASPAPGSGRCCTRPAANTACATAAPTGSRRASARTSVASRPGPRRGPRQHVRRQVQADHPAARPDGRGQRGQGAAGAAPTSRARSPGRNPATSTAFAYAGRSSANFVSQPGRPAPKKARLSARYHCSGSASRGCTCRMTGHYGSWWSITTWARRSPSPSPSRPRGPLRR